MYNLKYKRYFKFNILKYKIKIHFKLYNAFLLRKKNEKIRKDNANTRTWKRTCRRKKKKIK